MLGRVSSRDRFYPHGWPNLVWRILNGFVSTGSCNCRMRSTKPCRGPAGPDLAYNSQYE